VRRQTRFQFLPPAGVSLATDRAAETDAEPETEERLVVADLSPHEEVVFLLHTAAETEHALMVQYLYAA
jgi:hypothetical protein